jgi:glycosyltransferase involved in cell wall biosynthesis
MTADAMGGVWTYALELSRGLSRRNVEVALATMGERPSPAQRREALAIRGVTLFESDHKLEWMSEPWSDVARAGAWLLSLEQRVAPDIVHLNGYCHGALPWVHPTVMVAHSCVLSWWRAVRRCEAPDAYTRYREEVARGLRAAGRVVAPSRAMLAMLGEEYGPIAGATVIHNGRDAAAFAPGRKEAMVFSAGRLVDEAKNVRVLAEIAPRLPWPVLVAGEVQRSDPPRMARQRIGWLGPLSTAELAGHLSRAAIYALPARYEPFGLSVLEAALAGCALVLGKIPSLEESWKSAAFFVPPDDSQRLQEILLHLMMDPALLSAMAARARARALVYSAEEMTGKYLALYRDLRGGPPAENGRARMETSTLV